MLFEPGHAETLKNLSKLLSETQDSWWVLGSAAIALSGIDAGDVRDIDVLISMRDAEHLMRLHQLKNQADGGTELYRSEVFLRPTLGPVPVEIMSNYCIRTQGQEKPLVPATREQVDLEGVRLYVPDLPEQMVILKALGRAKDLQRIAYIKAMRKG